MNHKLNSKHVLAIAFLCCIILCGVFTLSLSPTKILGGLARGYINAPKDSNIFEKVSCSLQEFDKRVSEYFVLHDASIHAYGGIQKLLNRTLIHDVDKFSEVLKLNNGYLTFKSNADTDLTNLSQYLLDLKDVCASVNSKLIYVNKPSKSPSDEQLSPAHYPYIHTSNFKDIQHILEQNEIAVADIEQAVIDEDIDKYSLFFKTDHHWTPQAGIWISENICDTLNTDYNWQLNTDSFNMDLFSVETHSNSFLGSQGKRIGAIYTGVDDFYVVFPTYNTSFTVEMQDINYLKSGSLKDTLLFEDHITPDNLLNKDTTAYMTYMNGNHPLVKITNNLNTGGKRALIIMDSYGCVVAPYLALGFQQLDCIDIRSYSASIEDYIKQTSPDVVIYAIENFQQ